MRCVPTQAGAGYQSIVKQPRFKAGRAVHQSTAWCLPPGPRALERPIGNAAELNGLLAIGAPPTNSIVVPHSSTALFPITGGICKLEFAAASSPVHDVVHLPSVGFRWIPDARISPRSKNDHGGAAWRSWPDRTLKSRRS